MKTISISVIEEINGGNAPHPCLVIGAATSVAAAAQQWWAVATLTVAAYVYGCL